MALHAIRISLYTILFLFSAVLFGLCCARLHYTRHLEPYDPLNRGTPFYDPIVAELLAASVLTMLWAPVIAHGVHAKRESARGYFTSFLFEAIGLFMFFVLWLVGAAIASSFWGNLHFCRQYQTCRLLTALVAFAWMGWIIISILLTISVMFAIANNAFGEPFHGRWDPRHSHYRDSNVIETRTSTA
ncbi:hypothetical protein FIBSPDRAFT_1044777 [Athelia psychrophila]|uniref:MARVEL domain-containing protein n=1 Tax=Athelia psychrophila TaxID=1759441 RepID=A0A166J4Q7_9AGAM|nr:hypothetical protein FIBSPDRAFT_807146 [Fibularhizoctonia sp. CBS 109695]KZP20500.1 hypothetical protein FIBSPDRAFT_1044777 [Fibularhizoctonia sp. CBS 109695]